MLPDFQGRPASVEIDGEFLQVTRVRRGGQLRDTADPTRTWRELFHVTLEDHTQLTVIHDRVNGSWHAQPRESGPGALLRFPSAA